MFSAIFQKELLAGARNLKIPISVVVHNFLLGIVAGLAYYVEFQSKCRLGVEIQSKDMISVYLLLIVIEFLVVLVVAPAWFGGCITSEKEKYTLETMLVTRVNPRIYISAKLAANAVMLMVLVVSSLPVVAIVFLVGGVSILNLIQVYLIFLIVIVYLGAFGILCSVRFRHSTTAVVATYVIECVMLLGTLFLMGGFYLVKSAGTGEVENLLVSGTIKLGRWRYVLLLNPICTFAKAINVQTGTFENIVSILDGSEIHAGFLYYHWVFFSLTAQIFITILVMLLACNYVYPSINGHNLKKTYREKKLRELRGGDGIQRKEEYLRSNQIR